MGRSDNRYQWVSDIMRAFQGENVCAEAVATAFLTFAAENAKDRKSFMALMDEIGPMAVKFDESIKAKVKPEPEPEAPVLPAEVVQALALMGIDPSQVKVFTPRSTGAKAAESCRCDNCKVVEAGMGYLVKDVGEA